jgi:O-antigen/teichoic acid export membrane protein
MGRHRKANGIPSVGQTSATNVATVILGAIAGVIVARELGPHGRGVYAIATVAPTFIGIVGTLGVEEAVVYIAGRTIDRYTIGRLIWGSLALAIALGSLASVASVLFQLILFWRLSLGVSRVLFITMACQPLIFAISQVMLAHLRAQARYSTWNMLRILVSLVYLVGLTIVLSLGLLTVDTAIVCLISGNIAVMLGSILTVCFSYRVSTSRMEIESMLSYGWKNHLVTVQTYANQQLDQVFLAAMVPAAQLGLYAIAVTYASAGLSLGAAPALQMYSHFSRQKNPDRADYRRLMTRTLILLAGTCIVSAAMAPFIIPLIFGKSYRGAVTPALILVLSSPVLSLSAMYSAVWKSAGKPLTAAKAQGVGLLLTIISLPLAIAYLGILGAAIVSIIVYAVVAIWLWYSKPFDGLLMARKHPNSIPVPISDRSISSGMRSSR